MSLRIFNTLSRDKEPFDPIVPGKVGIYLCGPTVYDSPHVGHLVGPIIFDMMKRYLTSKGYAVTLVVNITDVDDKLIDASKKQGLSVKELAQRYTCEYLGALQRLGIAGIDHFPKVSEHIPEIVALIARLTDKGNAYADSNGNVWFSVATNPSYGRLSGRTPQEQLAGSREAPGEKRSEADFALWKAAKPGEPEWRSPWGKGRPGWHIECSAMAMKYLGESFDIHGGGDDLKFPHHENELAQSESATGKVFARFWCHNNLVCDGKRKLSKADGDALAFNAHGQIDKHGAELIRYLVLTSHYRSVMDFSERAFANALKGLEVFPRLFERAARVGLVLSADSLGSDTLRLSPASGITKTFLHELMSLKQKWTKLMDDDFNTAGVIATMHEMAGATNAFIDQAKIGQASAEKGAQDALAAGLGIIRELGLLIGLNLELSTKPAGQSEELLGRVLALLIDLRNEARSTGDFSLADKIRNRLIDGGVTLEDGPTVTTWRRN